MSLTFPNASAIIRARSFAVVRQRVAGPAPHSYRGHLYADGAYLGTTSRNDYVSGLYDDGASMAAIRSIELIEVEQLPQQAPALLADARGAQD